MGDKNPLDPHYFYAGSPGAAAGRIRVNICN